MEGRWDEVSGLPYRMGLEMRLSFGDVLNEETCLGVPLERHWVTSRDLLELEPVNFFVMTIHRRSNIFVGASHTWFSH